MRTIEILPEALYQAGSVITNPFVIEPSETEIIIYSKSSVNNFTDSNDKMSVSMDWSTDGNLWRLIMAATFEGAAIIADPSVNPRLVWWFGGNVPKETVGVRYTFNFQAAITLGFDMDVA